MAHTCVSHCSFHICWLHRYFWTTAICKIPFCCKSMDRIVAHHTLLLVIDIYHTKKNSFIILTVLISIACLSTDCCCIVCGLQACTIYNLLQILHTILSGSIHAYAHKAQCRCIFLFSQTSGIEGTNKHCSKRARAMQRKKKKLQNE